MSNGLSNIGVEVIEYDDSTYYTLKGWACSLNSNRTTQASATLRCGDGHAIRGHGGYFPDTTVAVSFQTAHADGDGATNSVGASNIHYGIKIMLLTATDDSSR